MDDDARIGPRFRFLLGYVVLALTLSGVYAYSVVQRSWSSAGGRAPARAAPMPPKATAAVVARALVSKFLGALTLPADYKAACALTSDPETCRADWPKLNVGVVRFDIVSVQVNPPDSALVVANVDGVRGFLILTWRRGRFEIDSLFAD